MILRQCPSSKDSRVYIRDITHGNVIATTFREQPLTRQIVINGLRWTTKDKEFFGLSIIVKVFHRIHHLRVVFVHRVVHGYEEKPIPIISTSCDDVYRGSRFAVLDHSLR
jgi:hypothetical protein